MSEKVIQDNQLTTAREFNTNVEKWSKKVQNVSLNIIRSRAFDSGTLARSLWTKLLHDTHGGGEAYIGLGFCFEKYGAFVEFGAGRGYIVKDGVIMRGHTAYGNIRERKKLTKERYKVRQLRNMKTVDDPYALIKRRAVPWLDPPIEKNIDELADISGEYYGDDALRQVLRTYDKIKMKKHG